MEPTPRKTDDQNQNPEESKDLKKELQETQELQLIKLEPESHRPFTPPPPYDPIGEVLDGVLYDLEVNPADGNYNDVDEYRQEVDSFLRLLFRIDDSTNMTYSPLKYDSHITIPDDGGETTVRIKFVLSSYGNQNNITFRSAAEDFCSRVFHQRSGPIVKHLTVSERLGLSPLSPVFSQYWIRALYHSCAQLGPGFFIEFLQARTERGGWPRWAVTVHFLFLGLGEAVGFNTILNFMPIAGAPLRSWAQSDSNQLTKASNTAAGYLRRYISDMLSSPVERQNRLFETQARRYQAQIHSVFTELERLSNYDFMVRDTVTIYSELYGAIESSCMILTANREMCDLLFSAQVKGGVGEAAYTAVGVGMGARKIYTSVKVTQAVAGRASMALRVTNWHTLALGALWVGYSTVGYFNSRGDRTRATTAKAIHKAVSLNVRSSLNISCDVLRAIRILQHREEILNDLEAGIRPFTENQAWWISTVNTGQETGFDMARVRSYLFIQKQHLMRNYEEIERLVPGNSVVTV
ncbi:hypothetical protein DFP73DRAFT_564951 [Morchella snyderi]|nr:hypothetical protein DFP73DRAFT_564951 [Morchella snyderi]